MLSKFRTLAIRLCWITVIVAFFALDFWGVLHPVKMFLSSDLLSIQVGERSFSVYFAVKVIIIVVILFWLTGVFLSFLEKHIKRLKTLNSSNKLLILKASQITVYFLAFVVGLDVFGLDLTTLAIFSGAIGIGVGIGLQKISSNFISGLILLFEKSIKENDLVELADGTYGFVRQTGARYTLIETFEGKEVMIPNEDFITGHVTNWTYSHRKGRVEIKLGISYDSDLQKAMNIMLQAAKEHVSCVDEPAPSCFIREFGDSAIVLLLFFWVEDVTEGRYEPQSDVMLSIWKQFQQHRITIPYPQRDVHLKSKEDA